MLNTSWNLWLFVVRDYVLGSSVEDMQLGCLWQGDYILSVSLSGFINYLDKSNTSRPYRIIKVWFGSCYCVVYFLIAGLRCCSTNIIDWNLWQLASKELARYCFIEYFFNLFKFGEIITFWILLDDNLVTGSLQTNFIKHTFFKWYH